LTFHLLRVSWISLGALAVSNERRTERINRDP
jgi:hypothetical protein